MTDPLTWARTSRMVPHFRVAESSSGKPIVMVEALKGEELPIAGFLSFDLPVGTELARAQEIVKFLTANIRAVTYTGPFEDGEPV